MKMYQDIPKVGPYHYFMPHIRVADLMNAQDKAFISRIAQIQKEVTEKKLGFFDFYEKLKAIQTYLHNCFEQEANSCGARGPIVINGEITVEGGSQSILSDRIGIIGGATTDKIACVHWDTGSFISAALLGIVRGFKPAKEKGGKKLTSGQIAYNAAKDEAARIAEAVKYDFEDVILMRLMNKGIEIPQVGKFAYFTSSPGQAKKGSGYLLNTKVFKEYPYFAWPVPAVQINEECKGKAPLATKWLQYRSLDLSTGVPSSKIVGNNGVRLSRTICVASIEKSMKAKVKSVSDNYETSFGECSDISNNMFDGAGMLNARRFGEGVALQIRSHYGCKGLLVSIDAVKYCNDRGYVPQVVDVDGVVHDLATEEWDAIVTTDVWKTGKVFQTWANYVKHCCEVELDEFYVTGTNAPENETKALSNQMTQSLFEMMDDEIPRLAERSIKQLRKFDQVDSAWSMLAAPNRDGSERTPFETLVFNYNSVLNTAYVRSTLNERKHSAWCKTMQGKLAVNGKYAYVCPDLTAFLDVICGHMPADSQNLGMLKAHECVCGIHRGAKRLACARNPAQSFDWVFVDVVTNKYLPSTNILFVSVHDLNYRVMQNDFDGDHIFVVNEQVLLDIIERTWPDVHVLYYEPTNGTAPKEIPTSRSGYNKWIEQSLSGTARTNKVGLYSTYLKSAWASVGQMPMEELLDDIAKLAAGVNHAVDAAKTGSMTPLPEDLMKKYGDSPYFVRYKKKVAKKIGDKTVYVVDPFDPYWDGLNANGECVSAPKTNPRGKGVIDRLDKYIETKVSYDLELDTSRLRFAWAMMAAHDAKYCIAERKASLSKQLAAELQKFGPIKANTGENSTPNSRLMAEAITGAKIGIFDLFNLLCSQKAAFFNAVDAKEEDGVDEYESEKARRFDNIGRIKFIREAIIGFMKSLKLDDYTNEELLRLAANWILRRIRRIASDAYAKLEDMPDGNARALKSEEDPAFMLRVSRAFDVFGDVYANNVLENRANGYVPQNRLEWVDANGNVTVPTALEGNETFAPGAEDSIFSLPEASDEDLLEQIPEDSTRYDEMEFPESL